PASAGRAATAEVVIGQLAAAAVAAGELNERSFRGGPLVSSDSRVENSKLAPGEGDGAAGPRDHDVATLDEDVTQIGAGERGGRLHVRHESCARRAVQGRARSHLDGCGDPTGAVRGNHDGPAAFRRDLFVRGSKSRCGIAPPIAGGGKV